MSRLNFFALTSMFCLFAGACSSSTGTGGTGGSNSGSGGSQTGSGGSQTGSGGNGSGGTGTGGSATGGASASGGTVGTGGTPASGGQTGSGGTPASGGNTGSGGAAGHPGSGGGSATGGTAGGGAGFFSDDFESDTAGKQPAGLGQHHRVQLQDHQPDGQPERARRRHAHAQQQQAGGPLQERRQHGVPRTPAAERNQPPVRARLFLHDAPAGNGTVGREPRVVAGHHRWNRTTPTTRSASARSKGSIGTNQVPSDNIAPIMAKWYGPPVITANAWHCIEVEFNGAAAYNVAQRLGRRHSGAFDHARLGLAKRRAARDLDERHVQHRLLRVAELQQRGERDLDGRPRHEHRAHRL